MTEFKNAVKVSLDDSNLTFPRLRCLRLEHVCFESKLFSKFLGPSLRHLVIPRTFLNLISETLETCEPLQHLHTLEVPELPPTRERCMPVAKFIKRHNHVQTLQVNEADSSSIRDTQLSRLIIPMLAGGGFDNLRCLSLSWGDGCLSNDVNVYVADIPEISLTALSTIVSLEQLSLCIGCSPGLRYNWLVNHDTIPYYLKGLNQLKMLALLRDTYYRPELENIRPSRYYDVRIAIDSDYEDVMARRHLDVDEDNEMDVDEDLDMGYGLYPGDAYRGIDINNFEYIVDENHSPLWGVRGQWVETDKRTWEKAHRNRMLTQAEAYAQVFPSLEWVYCGQRPMGFQPRLGEDGVVRNEAIPLSEERDPCQTLFNQAFWMR